MLPAGLISKVNHVRVGLTGQDRRRIKENTVLGKFVDVHLNNFGGEYVAVVLPHSLFKCLP